METWTTNVLGTINILESLRVNNHQCSSVIITSDKCYDNVEWEWGYRENDVLGGPDPYSASKGAAEIAIRSYVMSYFHPRDIDPGQPIIEELSLARRFKSYVNLKGSEYKLTKWLSDFDFVVFG